MNSGYVKLSAINSVLGYPTDNWANDNILSV